MTPAQEEDKKILVGGKKRGKAKKGNLILQSSRQAHEV